VPVREPHFIIIQVSILGLDLILSAEEFLREGENLSICLLARYIISITVMLLQYYYYYGGDSPPIRNWEFQEEEEKNIFWISRIL